MSRFVYQQLQLAQDAIDLIFSPKGGKNKDVLFYLPVTKSWIHQFVLSLVLIGHCPLRGVCEILRDAFDYHLSPAAVVQDTGLPAHLHIAQRRWILLEG